MISRVFNENSELASLIFDNPPNSFTSPHAKNAIAILSNLLGVASMGTPNADRISRVTDIKLLIGGDFSVKVFDLLSISTMFITSLFLIDHLHLKYDSDNP